MSSREREKCLLTDKDIQKKNGHVAQHTHKK